MQKFVVFDIDKVLYNGTLAVEFVQQLVKSGVIDRGLQATKDYLSAQDNIDHKEHDKLLVACLQAAQSIQTIDYKSYREIGAKVGIRCAGSLHKKPYKLLKEMSKERTIIAISTSPYAVVKPFCNELGLFDIIIAPMAQNIDGKIGPRSIIKSSERNKAEWLKGIVALYGLDFTHSVGIGDSVSDIPFLDLVERPIAFEPDDLLKATAEAKQWEIWNA